MRQFAAYLLLRMAAGLFGLLSLRLAQGLGAAIAVAFSYLTRGRREMVARHVRRLGATEPSEQSRAVRKVFAGYGRYWAEAFWVRPRRRHQIEKTTTAEGLDWVREANAGGKGMILALPHLGNWEFAGPIADEIGFRLVAVAENLSNRYLREWFIRLRNSMGIDIVLATGGASVMRELEAVLSQNGAVALVCDRDLKRRGIAVEFFGEETTLPAGPVSLSLRTGAPVIPVAAYFGEGDGHHVVVRPPLSLPSTGVRAEDLKAGTQLLAHALEDLIMAAPEQWHLLQPNWPSDLGGRA